MKTYVPISCAYYDELTLLVMRQTNCTVEYFDTAETPMTVVGKIKDVFSRTGEEFLLLSTGQQIRLDKLISVNGKKPSLYC